MTRLGWLVFGTILVLCAGVAAFITWYQYRPQPVPPAETQATTTPVVDPSALAIYTSGEYGFSFFYPANSVVYDAFTATSTAGLSWRQGATASGTPAVRVTAGGSELRIGLSSAAREVSACVKAGPAEKALAPVTVGSTTWSHFSFQKIGTSDERQVESYRVVRKGQCVALETFVPLNAPAASSPGFSFADSVQSFTFAD